MNRLIILAMLILTLGIATAHALVKAGNLDIKLRAEYKAGDLLKEMKVNGQYGKGKRKSASTADFKAQADLGIRGLQKVEWRASTDSIQENAVTARLPTIGSGGSLHASAYLT